MTYEIQGYCDERFNAVREVFKKNFEEGLEVGASYAIVLHGNLVVDLWGGFTDAKRTKLWTENTIVNVFSTSKIITALCIHLLVDRGLVDLDSAVMEYWPEFGQSRKENVLVRHVLSHTAGLPGFTEKVTIKDMYDWERVINLLEIQKPWWKPGSRLGYHSLTYGYLLGEIVRRVTGKTLGTFFRDEIAYPFSIDFHFGLSEEQDSRVAEVVSPDKAPTKFQILLAKLLLRKTMKIATNPPVKEEEVNTRAWRAVEIPAANGHGNARSIARIGSILASGGVLDDKRIISRVTVENAIEEQKSGRDPYAFYLPMKWGLGVSLENDKFLLGSRSFYWSGMGGSICVMDLEKNVSMAYAMNKMVDIGRDEIRSERLVQTSWDVLSSL
ncbi:MAG: serine hydrolase domain-containing protein [Candidatus Odinarchaeota archaeon]